MLARLNGIDGVQGTAASLRNAQDAEEGSLIRVSLRPGANPAKVAEEVQRILREEVQERAVEPVAGRPAAAALQQKEWLDTGQLGEVAALERGSSERRTSMLLALLLAVLGVGLSLLAYRYLRHRADPSGPLAANHLRP